MTTAHKESLGLLLRLTRIGIALSSEKNPDKLLEMIVEEAMSIANADGCTLYLRKNDHLEFNIIHTRSLDISIRRNDEKGRLFQPISLFKPDGAPNDTTQVVFAVLHKESVNIADMQEAKGRFAFQGTQSFDSKNQYRTISALTIPMQNYNGNVIGALQLINAQDPVTGNIIPFSEEIQQVMESLASQAAVAIDNQQLIQGQKDLLEAFIQVIARTIDEKSPFTGKHCERVPVLTEMLAEEACRDTGKFADFSMTDEERYELHIAGWLHDCGKVTTPVHILDKATKLETIHDRIEMVKARFEVLRRDAEIAYLKSAHNAGADILALKKKFETTLSQLQDDLSFIQTCNIGQEFMEDSAIVRLEQIAQRQWRMDGKPVPLLTPDELYNLKIRRGTLTQEERTTIMDHIVLTIDMLEDLPFPPHLARVPEYAGGHHERMDGKGYPKGLHGHEMSLPARMMAIADVFEALTAQDRPYKKPKRLSESLRIMAGMKKTHHLDPDLLDLFVRSKLYLRYAEQFLTPDQIDEVDESMVFNAVPEPVAS